MKAQWRALRAAAMSAIVLVGLAGCELTEETVTVDKHNRLVRDYNDLVERYNNQTGRNVAMDRRIRTASTRLEILDTELAAFTAQLLQVDVLLIDGQCAEARELVDGDVRARMSAINSAANELSQGSMVASLDAMLEDMSSYREEVRERQRAEIQSVRERMTDGLLGTKLHVRYSLEQKLEDVARICGEEERTEIEEVIESGGVVTVDESGSREIISSEALRREYSGYYDESAYTHFSEIASLSGGFVGFSPTAELFSNTVDVVLESILERAGAQTDVAIVLDTTGSMGDDIGNVQDNMGRLIERLQERADEIGLRLSLILYKDTAESYVTREALDFTSDLDSVDSVIQSVTVGGGGDNPEAVNDALLTALNDLSWRSGANRSVVLIGDAPGHSRSYAGNFSTEDVVSQYRDAGLGIIVYPILVSK